MTKLTIDDDNIFALMTEAAEAGDLDQVGLCQNAIDGIREARLQCEAVITACRAASDTDEE